MAEIDQAFAAIDPLWLAMTQDNRILPPTTPNLINFINLGLLFRQENFDGSKTLKI